MTKIEIADDQTLSVTWVGKKGRGSLMQIAAEGNAKHANALDARELWAVIHSVKACPFPLGASLGQTSYADVYRDVLAWIDTTGLENIISEEGRSVSLGDLRRYVVVKAGEGFNAPTDSYLRTAHELKTTTEPATC